MKLTIPVSQTLVRAFRDPNDPELHHHRGLVNVQNLPLDLPKGLNPRDVNLKTGVAKAIERSLWKRDGLFHLLNRGLTILAEKCRYDTSNNVLVLDLDSDQSGILDGFHTYTIIANALKSKDWKSNGDGIDQYAWVEILSGVPNPIEIVEARNTSVPVTDDSMDNLRNYFSFIKESLEREPFADKVGYNQFAPEPVKIKEIIQLMTLFNIELYPIGDPPVKTYTSLRGTLIDFEKECKESEERDDSPIRPKSFSKLFEILPVILKLHDHLYLHYPEYYRKANEPKGSKFGGRVEIRKGASEKLHFLDKESEYYVPKPFLYPVLASLRSLVDMSGMTAKWTQDPFGFLDEHGPSLIQKVFEFSETVGRNPNKLGKAKPIWSLLELAVRDKLR